MGAGWDGARAFERLARWYARRAAVSPDDEDPLDTLADLGAGRRLLDEAEMEAVRVARRRGRSWAEIATKLGVTRQSAWERWRDLDDSPEVAQASARTSAPGSARARRRDQVTVPDVIGMTLDAARVRLSAAGLVGVTDPDGPPDPFADALVVDQAPESGAQMSRGAVVRLFTQRGGDSGVREPRRPRPTPLTGRKALDEPAGDAVE